MTNIRSDIKNLNPKSIIAGLALALFFLGCALLLAACGTENGGSDAISVKVGQEAGGGAAVVLRGDSAQVTGSGANYNGGALNITASGTYTISGALTDGRIIVYAADDAAVRLVLAGAAISSPQSGCIEILNCKKTVIELAAGTENTLLDSDPVDAGAADGDLPDAAIFSKCDLSVTGSGSLKVISAANNGIKSTDGLLISGGAIAVEAGKDGLRGKDYLKLQGGAVTVDAGSDGLQAANTEDGDQGYVEISGGSLKVTAAKDGVQAGTSVLIEGGSLDITAGGGSGSVKKGGQAEGPFGNNSAAADLVSRKGIKAPAALIITGGTLKVDAADDALHSNGSITIAGGRLTLASGDDAIHADSSVAISKGAIDITSSYEGIESQAVTVSGGSIAIVATDDGINVAGGADASGFKGPLAPDSFSSSGALFLKISGGYLVIDAQGDGLDSNGSIEMTGGQALVSGPQSNGNGAIDYGGSFVMSGGYLVAAGSSGMAEAPGDLSTQNVLMVNFEAALAAGTLVRVESASGEDIVTYSPLRRQYQSLVVCSPDLQKGGSYSVSTGGSCSGTIKDGLYSGGVYTGGSKYADFTVSATVTKLGSSEGLGGGSGGGMGGPGGGSGGGPGGVRPEKP